MVEFENAVFFLGAGATRQDFPTAPLTDDLLHAILLASAPQDPFPRFLRHVFAETSVAHDGSRELRPRIDDVFTVMDAHLAGRAPAPDHVSLDEVVAARAHLVASIGKVLRDALQSDRLGQVSKRCAERFRELSATVISTNYDIVMDNALANTANINYGVAVRMPVERKGGRPERARPDEVHHFQPHPLFQGAHQVGPLPMLKLHGSLNWLYCPRCDELDITLGKKGAVDILTEPVVSRCAARDCTARYEAVIVGPSLVQRYDNRILRDTWRLAEKALQEAPKLVTIGYSLPEADYLIRAMLARHFSRRSGDVMVVTNPKTEEALAEFKNRHRGLFPQCKFYVEGFASFVSDRLGGIDEERSGYWVCEDLRDANDTKVHLGSCSRVRERSAEASTTRWHGPFQLLRVACAEAAGIARNQQHDYQAACCLGSKSARSE